MSGVQELEPVELLRGCQMRFFIDHSQPTDSIKHQWTETSYDGKPESELLQIPKHWHKDHDEYMEVVAGRMTFYMEGRGEVVLSAGDAVLKIPRWHVHGFHAFPGEPVRFKESTDPAGDYKELFFRDLCQTRSPSFLMSMRAFYDGDTWISLPGNIKILDQLFTALGGTIARAFVPPKKTGRGNAGGGGGDDDDDDDDTRGR